MVTTRDAGVTRVTTSAFAIDLPGPPVKMTVVADGQPETTLELIAHGGP
mgnify:CR=1 FL=1